MKQKTLLLMAVAALALAGCKSVKEELGVGRHSPDEFSVVKRAPLTLPPDYNLRPPGEGVPTTASEVPLQTRAVLMGAPAAPVAKGSAETSLLEKMGAANASPDIRSVIDRENGYLALQNRSVADKLIFWKDGAVSPDMTEDPVVDPKAEAERLKKNEAEGKPATEGDVPVIEKKQGTIDKLF
jgi:hypothetical protein